MQPSSLIFVLVVALWAVYLVQHWARRRDHLLTIRSIDRFSEAMRVLDHQGLAGADSASKRSSDEAPTRARSGRSHQAAPEPVERPTAARPRLTLASVARVPRRVRGLVFLAHLVLLPTLIGVALLTSMTWVVPAVVLVGLLASFGWVRQGVRAEREAQMRAGRRRESAARPAAPSTPRVQRPGRRSRVAPSAPTHHQDEVHAATEPSPEPHAEPAEPATTPASEPAAPAAEAQALFDVDEFERTLATEAWQASTWEPRPVPRPTYTMKEKAAPRPMPEAGDAMTALPAVEDDLVALDDDLVTPLPRRATGS